MIELTINDMTCGGCVASITRVVKGLDPNAYVDADVANKRGRSPSDGLDFICCSSGRGKCEVAGEGKRWIKI